MLSIIKSFGLNGIEGYAVNVETDINHGLPAYEIVGLVGTSTKESKQRVKSAIKNSGLEYPIIRITINLSPAHIKKEGPVYDLAIAIGILTATSQVNLPRAKEFVFLGELSLDGSVKRVNGVLPVLIAARSQGFKNFIIPKENENEAGFISGINVFPVETLRQAVSFLNGETVLAPVAEKSFSETVNSRAEASDFKYVKGQSIAKRALEIAAAGGHNIIMVGPPGSGKTMLAKCFPSVLPKLTFEESLEVTKIHSVAGVLDLKEGIITSRPFRAPHHTATTVALTGGGKNAKPGEISLAHNGVLFLDEMPEYTRHTIETLRQPLEDGLITVARAENTVEYPANFTLIASMNPCPCGHYGSREKECKCTPQQIRKYLSKLSAPLMDRIDIHIEADNVKYKDLRGEELEEPSSEIKKRVDAAREIQLIRFKGNKNYSNAKMNDVQLKQYCKLDNESEQILKTAFEKMKMSARGYSRILKVARTIADLDGQEHINESHIMEAISYRNLDNKYFN